MTDKLPKQQYIDIQNIPFQNVDPINSHPENTYKCLVVLKPKLLCNSIIYQTSEANSSIPFNLLIQYYKNRWWVITAMNDGIINFMIW